MTDEQPTLKRTYDADAVRQDYSRVTGFYDFWSRMTEFKAAQRAIQWAAVEDGEAVLEVAVGTGIVFEQVVRQNPSGDNEGVDLSPAMLAKATGRLAACPSDSYHLQEGSAYHLPFNDETFDLLLNNYMLDLLPESDFEGILTEFKRVLKPGGRMVITAFAPGTHWYNRPWAWLAHYFPALLTDCRPIQLLAQAKAAGFADVRVESISQNTFPSNVFWMKKPAAE